MATKRSADVHPLMQPDGLLKLRRRLQSMSRRSFARSLGVTDTTLARWERKLEAVPASQIPMLMALWAFVAYLEERFPPDTLTEFVAAITELGVVGALTVLIYDGNHLPETLDSEIINLPELAWMRAYRGESSPKSQAFLNTWRNQ